MPRLTEATAAARRERIISAASTCFARNGFHRTTMKQICAEAKLSPGSVYSWFPSKQAIIEELTRRRLASFVDALAEAESDPRRAVKSYLNAMAEAVATPGIARMNVQLVADAGRDRFARDTMRTVAREGAAVLTEAFRRLRRGSRQDAEARARLLQAAALGMVMQSLVLPRDEVASLELAERLISP